MAKISFNSIVPLAIKSSPVDGVQSLLREIIVLQAKLDAIGEQDFYFQKGRSLHEKRLNEMKSEYSQMVDLVNNKDVDFFLDQINEAEEKFQQICSRESNHPIFAKVLVDAKLKSQISYFKMLLQAKGQYKKLKTLDELMKDETALVDIFS